jgi:ATP phosphoribosyltransferase
MKQLCIALAKGRLQKDTLKRFAAHGIIVAAEDLASRRLVVEDESGCYRFLLVKPSDVPTYVQYGVADAGVCGSDVLVESGADVHAPLDLGFGRCKLAVAGKVGDGDFTKLGTVRIATKFPKTATAWFHARGIPVEVVKLNGSVELAAVLGLADRIVDLVETGQTLVANGLEVQQEIADVSARLIVNRAAWQLRGEPMLELVRILSEGDD